ncbi:hypothetical protein DQQ10_05685 [Pseudochryseolinea flava]|uniref:Uncharacterized protein n=2 Tax=Pseudochryseolinea flava TaxID=2059302 RepID=A0A364Y7D0_9BACT|nr:hypothetical protein DQQ10_05685 [Pseudochryseolinea flava]
MVSPIVAQDSIGPSCFEFKENIPSIYDTVAQPVIKKYSEVSSALRTALSDTDDIKVKDSDYVIFTYSLNQQGKLRLVFKPSIKTVFNVDRLEKDLFIILDTAWEPAFIKTNTQKKVPFYIDCYISISKKVVSVKFMGEAGRILNSFNFDRPVMVSNTLKR